MTQGYVRRREIAIVTRPEKKRKWKKGDEGSKRENRRAHKTVAGAALYV